MRRCGRGLMLLLLLLPLLAWGQQGMAPPGMDQLQGIPEGINENA